MTKATAAFTVRSDEGQLLTFKPGDVVPDEVAAKVGAHVLDEKPEAPEENPLAGLDFENADEALKAALKKAAEQHDEDEAYAAELEKDIESLTAERDDLRAFKDRILSGNLEDLDLDALRKEDEEAGPDEEQATEQAAAAAADDAPQFDPSEHHHTVVLKYLESADPAEDERVRAAEKAGRARPSILGDES